MSVTTTGIGQCQPVALFAPTAKAEARMATSHQAKASESGEHTNSIQPVFVQGSPVLCLIHSILSLLGTCINCTRSTSNYVLSCLVGSCQKGYADDFGVPSQSTIRMTRGRMKLS